MLHYPPTLLTLGLIKYIDAILMYQLVSGRYMFVVMIISQSVWTILLLLAELLLLIAYLTVLHTHHQVAC